jgi:hypothetical protein
MSANNSPIIKAAALLLAIWWQPAWAEGPARKTIDDIVQTAKKKITESNDVPLNRLQTPTPLAIPKTPTPPLPPSSPPPPKLSMALPPPSPPPPSPNLSAGAVLVGLFLSPQNAIAEFNIDGQVRYLPVGGRLQGGWVIDQITRQGVHLSKCARSKSCEFKVVHFEAS